MFLHLFLLQFIGSKLDSMCLHIVLLFSQFLLYLSKLQQLRALVKLSLYLKLPFDLFLKQNLLYDLFFMSVAQFFEHSIYLFIEIFNDPFPLKFKQVHFCLMSFSQFIQLSLMSVSNLQHLFVFKLLPQNLHFPLKAFSLNVLPFRFALFLLGYCLLPLIYASIQQFEQSVQVLYSLLGLYFWRRLLQFEYFWRLKQFFGSCGSAVLRTTYHQNQQQYQQSFKIILFFMPTPSLTATDIFFDHILSILFLQLSLSSRWIFVKDCTPFLKAFIFYLRLSADLQFRLSLTFCLC